MNRRKYLAGAAVAALPALAGCAWPGRGGDDSDDSAVDDPPTPPETSPPTDDEESPSLADEFEHVVDIVDAGADPTGQRPIDDVLRSHAADDTLVTFPPGRYRLETEFVSEVSRLGLQGDDATIVPADGNDQVLFGLGWRTPASELAVEGLTFDFRAADTGGRPLLAKATDRILARNLTVRGEVDVRQDIFRFDVTEPDGYGIVRGLRLPDGALRGTGVTGMEVGDDNAGDIDFIDCHVAGFPDNGLYADPPEGRVRVFGGTYLNNGIAGVRVEADEAVVRNVHVRCDDAEGAGDNMRGIRLRRGRSVLVENCLVEILDVTSSDGAVTFATELEAAVVRNCSLRVDADGVNAIRVKSGVNGERRGPFRCENIRIDGEAETGASIQLADARGCTLRDISIHHPGTGRDGIVADNVTGTLRNTSIAVTGRPFQFENSDFDRNDVTVDRISPSAADH